MKKCLLLLLGGLLLSGCSHRYDMTLVNGMMITRVTRPKLNKETGMYEYKDIRGEKKTINESRVVEIAPSSERKLKPGQKQ